MFQGFSTTRCAEHGLLSHAGIASPFCKILTIVASISKIEAFFMAVTCLQFYLNSFLSLLNHVLGVMIKFEIYYCLQFVYFLCPPGM